MTYTKKIITYGRRVKQGKESRAKRRSMRQEKPTHYAEPIFTSPRQTTAELLMERQIDVGEFEELRREEAQERNDDEYEEYAYYYRHELAACGGTKDFPWAWPEQ